jgi:DNA ligase-4
MPEKVIDLPFLRCSQTFKVGWTFRFPRAEKLRDDKYWHDCLSLQEFQEMVELAKANGNMMDICNTGTNGQKENLQAQIKQAGGTTVMNLHHSVTHVIASQPTGIHYKAAVSSNWDVINLEWLESCIHSKELMPINPRHYFHMSKATKENHKDDIDSYGDPYFNPIDVADIHKILAKVGDGPPLLPDIRQMIKKILPKSGHWALFQGICLYLVPPIHSTNPDTQAVTQATLKRLGLEATWVGGSVSSTLHEAVTHVVVFTTPETPVFLHLLLSSIQVQEQRELLGQSGVNIVSHVWLQDCLQQHCILSVATYSLRYRHTLRLLIWT